MVSTYTVNKGLEQPAHGDYSGNWDVPLNADMGWIDTAFGGVTSLNATSGSAILTLTQYRSLILNISGSISSSVVYTIPSGVGGQWLVNNSTSGTGTVTFSSGGGGTSYSPVKNVSSIIYSDGTNIGYAGSGAPTIPSGVITMWSGSIASIPSGWYLCDGTNGTPDLRSKFIVGAGSTYNPGNTGGSADATLVSHTHTATVTDPGHTHSVVDATYAIFTGTNGNYTTGARGPAFGGPTYVNSGSSTTGITVGVSTVGSSATNANLPPYYALAYIMKS